MNVKNVISKAKTNFKTRVVPAVISAGTAVSAVAISASAEGVSSNTTTVNYSEIGTKLLAGFGDIIGGCVDVAVAVVPMGLGLYGIGLVWSTAKKFFTKATN